MNEKYIEALRDAIRRTHGCESQHVETALAHEIFERKTARGKALSSFST